MKLIEWSMEGLEFTNCNCDWGCPGNFNARPTSGKCEGGWTWQVDRGTYGDVTLDGLCFSVYANWPGAIHDGNGEALLLVDERADAAQRSAIETLLGGIEPKSKKPFRPELGETVVAVALQRADDSQAQHLLARASGDYRRGNERS